MTLAAPLGAVRTRGKRRVVRMASAASFALVLRQALRCYGGGSVDKDEYDSMTGLDTGRRPHGSAARVRRRRAGARARNRAPDAPGRDPISRRRIAAVSALLVAIAVPALAQPISWDTLAARAFGLDRGKAAPTPMPFERPGYSFPGSAFYYLEETPRLALDFDELRVSGDKEGTVQFAASRLPADASAAAAPAFQSAGSGIDKARALQCLSMAVYYEAASESHAGQEAVAQVVLNRVAHPAYPNSVCGVVFQGSERHTGCQFTFTCDGSLNRRPAARPWAVAQSVALEALSGKVFAPVGTATHYHTHAVNPYWASSLDLIGSIGAHRFYRWKGRAGLADAFSMSYRGGEPLAAPKPRLAGDPVPPLVTEPDRTVSPPLVPGRTLSEPPSPAEAFAPPRGSGPVEATQPPVNDNLPGGGTVKPEYARSGQWIRKPGT